MGLLVLALDGLDTALVCALGAARLPTLHALQDRAQRHRLAPELPLVSPRLWASMLTGQRAGRHGVLDLVTRQGGAYRLRPSGPRRVPTILPSIAATGRVLACIGLPGSYPLEALPAPCLQVAGFDAPWDGEAAAAAIAPPADAARIARLGGWSYGSFNELLDPDRDSQPQIAAAIRADLRRKTTTLVCLLRERRWDLFIAHLQAADTAAHHLWPPASVFADQTAGPDAALTGPPAATTPAIPPLAPTGSAGVTTPPVSPWLASVYQELDRSCAALLAAAGPEPELIVLADHGMGGASGACVHLNRALARAGLLVFHPLAQWSAPWLRLAGELADLAPGALRGALRRIRGPAPLTRLASHGALTAPIDPGRTLAWAQEVDASPAVHLNLIGRDPQGRVQPAQAERLLDEIGALLLDLRDPRDGQPIFSAVHRGAALDPGPAAPAAADLVLEYAWRDGRRASTVPAWGVGPALTLRGRPGGKGRGMPGVHRGAGLCWLIAPDATPGPAITLRSPEVAHLIAARCGCELPVDRLGAHEQTPPASAAPARLTSLSPSAAAAVARQLRDLGYID